MLVNCCHEKYVPYTLYYIFNVLPCVQSHHFLICDANLRLLPKTHNLPPLFCVKKLMI